MNSDPVLYGVAAGLAVLFPPVNGSKSRTEPSRADQPDDSRGTAKAP